MGGDGLTCGHAADDAGACDGSVHDGDDVGELCLERGVKVGRGVHRGEAVAVRELGEDADVAAVFELDAYNAVRSVAGVQRCTHGWPWWWSADR